MLTAFQCDVVAYLGDGEVYCPECAPDQELGEGTYNDHGIIRYTADEEWPEGLSCGGCGAEIVEPGEDYCSAHDSWRAYTDSEQATCEAVLQDGDLVDDPCSFPKS